MEEHYPIDETRRAELIKRYEEKTSKSYYDIE